MKNNITITPKNIDEIISSIKDKLNAISYNDYNGKQFYFSTPYGMVKYNGDKDWEGSQKGKRWVEKLIEKYNNKISSN